MRTLIGRRGALAAWATLTAALWARNSPVLADELLPLSGVTKVTPPGALPDLGFTTMDGGRVALSSFRGKPLVLNFWATWCGPCVLELPDLDRLAAGGVQVVAVSADHGGAGVVKPFLVKHDVSHAEVVLDAGGEARQAAGVVGFPTTLIIDAQGRLRGRLEGPADWSKAAGLVGELTA
jgi:thiol-disulfide isomerase/thioredoxin